MDYFKQSLTALIVLVFSFGVSAQKPGKKTSIQNAPSLNETAKSSPAYAEVLLLKTEFEAQLEDLLVSFTDDFPKVKELRFQINLIQKQMDRILGVGSAEAGKLSTALGKLIVRKVELETELWSLKAQYNDDFPEVKKTKRKVEIFDRAIKEILP